MCHATGTEWELSHQSGTAGTDYHGKNLRFSLLSVAMIKYCDEKQPGEESAYLVYTSRSQSSGQEVKEKPWMKAA